jgi:predicted outer membrane repeat protein
LHGDAAKFVDRASLLSCAESSQGNKMSNRHARISTLFVSNSLARLRAAFLPACISAGLLAGTATLHAQLHTPLVIVPTPQATRPSNCDDAGPGSLRDLIATAASGDVIDLTHLNCSTISLSTGELAIAQASLILIGPGSAALAIDGGGTQRVFTHTGGSTLQIQGMTVRNGYAQGPSAYGGCIRTNGSTLILDDTLVTMCKTVASPCSQSFGGAVFAPHDAFVIDSTISNSDAEVTTCALNYSAEGGGLYVTGDLSLQGSTISGNKVGGNPTSSGGGLFLRSGGTLTDAHISGNYAPSGGGVISLGAVQLVRTTLDSNHAFYRGGGLSAFGAVTFDASDITGNATSDSNGQGGGGAWMINAPAVIRDTRFAYNSAVSGAALYAQGDLTLERSTIAYNTNGSAIYAGGSNETGVTTISNSTIAGNTQGTALASAAVSLRGPATVSNSTFAFNNFFATGGLLASGPTFELHSTLMAANTGMNGPSDLLVVSNTFSGDHNLITATTAPVLPGTISTCPKLDRLAMNGGVTPTIMLLHGSAGIDAGTNPLTLATDQRGTGFVREFGDGVDIGAFERQGEVDDALFSSAFEAYCDSHKR